MTLGIHFFPNKEGMGVAKKLTSSRDSPIAGVTHPTQES